MLRYDYLIIEKARQREGLTQREAAELAGISLRQWQKYEYGEAEPGIKAFLKMVNALGGDPFDLLIEQ